MKIVIIYRPKSQHATPIESFVRDLKQRYGSIKLEMLNLDEREGGATASIYDVVAYPAILAIAGDGRLLQLWQGPELPLIDAVAAYAVTA